MTARTRLAGGGGAQRAAQTEPPGQRPTWAQIDLDAIAANVTALKDHAAAPRLLAAVKADGYGHGLVPAARAAIAGGADWLGVALVEEGTRLRAAGVAAPILLFTEPPPAAIPALLDAGLTPAVYTPAFTAALDAAAAQRGEQIAVHLKLDTGMRRVGVPEADWDDALVAVRDARALRLGGLWSHLAVADDPDDGFTLEQARAFRRGVALAESLGLRPDLVHLCNSAGTLWLHDHHYDMVRTGIAVYGLSPSPRLAGVVPLRPALSLWSRLALVKHVAAGESVSYGLRWTAPRATNVATVPAGYADGIARRLSNTGQVVVRGARMPIVGTICMDQLLVDAGDVGVCAGDDVAFIGGPAGVAVTADEWAEWLDTINYEVVCAIGERVPRVYIGAAGAP